MNQVEIESRVGLILSEVTRSTPEMDDNLFEKGLLDSLQIVNLILMLEEVFHVPLTEREISFEKFKSKRHIVAEVLSLRGDASACDALSSVAP